MEKATALTAIDKAEEEMAAKFSTVQLALESLNPQYWDWEGLRERERKGKGRHERVRRGDDTAHSPEWDRIPPECVHPPSPPAHWYCTL